MAALVGGLAGPSVVATVVLLGVWGFAGGLLVALGTRAALVGMLSTWALLLAGDLNLRGEAVLHEAWLITAGGLVQTGVVIAAWPLRPFAAESQAVGDAFRSLAAYARGRPRRGFRAPPPHSRRQPRPSGRALRGPGNAARCGRWSNKVNGSGWNWQRWPDRMRRASMRPCERLRTPWTSSLQDAVGVLAPGAQTHRTGIDEPVARRRAARLVGWITAAGAESRVGAPGAEPPRHPPARCVASSRCAPARFVTQRGCRLH